MWCHLPTGIGRLRSLRFVAVMLMIVALITTLLFASVTHAAPGISKTISFQGRLMTAAGAVVADGHYNMQFKIYQDGTGATAGNPGGTLKWTETYNNNGGIDGVDVKNGFFSVTLGSVNPFGTSVDWNQDTLFLSMNVAGKAAACTTFGTAPCAADGEMLPMKRITATPFSLNSGAVGGKTADNFVQLGQGIQTDASTNTSSIFINKTSTGNLIQLQNTAVDIFTVSNTGDIALGNNANKSISITDADANTTGRQLSVVAGGGGSGSGADGGNLVLQGGAAGGTNGNGGDVQIDAGVKTGTGSDGSIAIGETNASSITIGSTTGSRTQDISIGTNNTAGSVSNVTVGSGGSAAAGTTKIQAKNAVTIETNGTTRATFSDTTNTVYFGNGVMSAAPTDSTLQGTNSSATAVAGGSLNVQGGNATTGNANGGNVTIAGGSGSGSGSNGLVVLTTPTFSTVTNDANCYTSGAAVASSCTITASSVNNSSAVLVGFSADGKTATLPNPTITTAGRIMYIMAASGSKDFTLSVNGGGAGNQITLRQNTTATVLWNGSAWTSANTSSSTTLQDAYNNTPQTDSGSSLTLSNSGDSATQGISIQDSNTNPVNDALLEVKNASSTTLFSVNSNNADHQTDGNVHDGVNFSTNWPAAGSASTARITTDGQEASDSAEVTAGTTAGNGVKNKLFVKPLVSTHYRTSVYAKLATGSAFTDFTVRYSPDNGTTFVDCSNYNTQTVVTTGWTQITCDFTTGTTPVTNPYVYFTQATSPASARTYLVDSFSLTLAISSNPNVQIGSGAGGDQTTLFTVDKAAAAPTASDSNALLGSMYYDTTLGKLQCYEAAGWGACGASPDTFITQSPQYTNAVTHDTGIGTMTSDLCSDSLNINDGSSSQPTICGTNETYNFYKWTSSEATTQTRSIFVTYQLSSTFKEFVPESTSVLGRTDSTNSGVTYQVYRNHSSGLTACGSAVPVSSGVQTAWQTAVATGSSDPSNCGFVAGDSIVIRINLTSNTDANAYISNLSFIYSNH
ncbi:MAG: hypothetical protein ABIQ04_04160 [Candidatus Saccharimonadales bacterium]